MNEGTTGRRGSLPRLGGVCQELVTYVGYAEPSRSDIPSHGSRGLPLTSQTPRHVSDFANLRCGGGVPTTAGLLRYTHPSESTSDVRFSMPRI